MSRRMKTFSLSITCSLYALSCERMKRVLGETSGYNTDKKVKKVKLSLCLTKHHAMKTYWGSGGIVLRILDLGTRWR
jgi:hypothetical protein